MRRGGEDVAVTGMGVRCAIAAGTEAFAGALRAGRVGITAGANGDLPGAGPHLTADLEPFDLGEAVAAVDGLHAATRRAAMRAARRAPLAVQVAVAVGLEGWRDAGLHAAPVPADRIGIVVAGHNLGGRYAELVRPRFETSPVHLPARYALHFLDTDHVGIISHVLAITGEGYTVGGASASGNVAIVNGVRLVSSGAVDVCLVLGALTDLSSMERQSLFNLGAMAGARGCSDPHTRCRPFDEAREGFVPGQGAACLVLESKSSLLRRRAAPAAWITGYAQRLDANHLADPSVAGEAAAMTQALRGAGLESGQVDYVNTHGTGSPLGDDVEIKALQRALGADFPRPWINSTKGLVGHCLCAAGVVEAVATVAQLREGFMHPNANLERPIDPGCRFVGHRAEEAAIDHALSNAFGFGGFNTSIVFAHPRTRRNEDHGRGE